MRFIITYQVFKYIKISLYYVRYDSNELNCS